jgi:group I intron endonuclease
MKILGPNETYIYCLIHDNHVRYVGKSDNPSKRFEEHLRKCKYQITYKDKWLFGLIESSQKPELLILDKVPFDEFGFWEDFYINLFKSYGFKLTNLAPGGCGGNFGLETNKKISEKLKGRIFNEEWKLKISKYRTGKKHSEETKSLFKIQRKNEGNSMFGVKRKQEWDEKKRKKIYQIDGNGKIIKEWNSIQEASTNTNTNRTSINYVLSGKRKTAGGYKWVYSSIY